MWAAILFFLAAVVYAQQPKPCISPPQWEARFYRTDYSKNFTEYSRISYDETNKRVRETEEVQSPAQRDYYDVLRLYNENKEYRLNLRDHKCNVTTLTRKWIPFGIPDNAKYEGEGSIGPVNIPDEHVTIIRFEGETPDKDMFFGTVTSPDCIPVTSGFRSNQTGFIHTTFFDVTKGIVNPTVFNPPPECKTLEWPN